MKFFRFFLGSLSTILYGYLKYNVDGYWFVFPFIIVVMCLSTD